MSGISNGVSTRSSGHINMDSRGHGDAVSGRQNNPQWATPLLDGSHCVKLCPKIYVTPSVFKLHKWFLYQNERYQKLCLRWLLA